MINFEHDTSNNITFPAESRKVMILIDGKYYRLEVLRNEDYHGKKHNKRFDGVELNYKVFVEDKKTTIAKVHLYLTTNNNNYDEHDIMQLMGHKEVPPDFFELKAIVVDENYRGIGTMLLNYVMNDIQKFNKLQGKNIKVLLQRINSEITIPFYYKFGAKDNHAIDLNEISEEHMRENLKRVRFMIIDNPKPVGEIPTELADDFDYSSFGEQNPFEKIDVFEK